MNKGTCNFSELRNKDCNLLEKTHSHQTANTGWEQEELDGSYLGQQSQECARKTCSLLQACNERTGLCVGQEVNSKCNVTHATLFLGSYQLAQHL